jgi:GH43 family beta-xylosidase
MNPATYLNPVYHRDFPDPFVLKYLGEYWAYGTGFWDDGRAFGILRSSDLVHWQPVGGAMEPLPGGHTCYWAPELLYDNGRFYLYYSVGNEETMQIRVAVANHPAGPFVDSGHTLTREPFAIDAHVFTDDDGRRYLFYATDFLDHSHIGTGTVYDEMLDFYTLAGRPQPATRACYDWQVYHPQRPEKGGVRWHTVEGSFVLKRKGLYYHLFSGGNWQNPSYGVGYATSPTLDRPDEWPQACDGERVLPVLRTIPGVVIGPGHNSVVRGPDNRQLYCVYHRWDTAANGRVPAIDRLDWAGERLLVLGPSHTPQPIPLPPSFAGFSRGWRSITGQWAVQADGSAVLTAGEVRYPIPIPAFLAELSLRADQPAAGGLFGLKLYAGEEELFRFWLPPAKNIAAVAWHTFDNGWQEQELPLPAAFDPTAYHLLRLELDGRRLSLALDEPLCRWQGRLAAEPAELALFAEATSAAFAGFSATIGWEDSFMDTAATPQDNGWHGQPEAGWRLDQQQLWFTAASGPGHLVKGPLLPAYELVVNARLAGTATADCCYGFYPAWQTPAQPGPLLVIEQEETNWVLRWQEADTHHIFPLPAPFDPTTYHHFHLRKENGRLHLYWEGLPIAEGTVTTQPTTVALYAGHSSVAFDLVRVTAIGSL